MATITFSGLPTSERNSSRVLAPPGGRSNIFFGGEPEPARKPKAAPVQQQQQQQQQVAAPVAAAPQEEAAPRRDLHRSSITFGTEEAAATAAAVTAAAPGPVATTMKPVSSQAAGTGTSKPRDLHRSSFDLGMSVEANKHTVSDISKPVAELSTIQGKTRGDVHTSSRVLAPPGGRCHNIFG